jgi:hypothetical protein
MRRYRLERALATGDVAGAKAFTTANDNAGGSPKAGTSVGCPNWSTTPATMVTGWAEIARAGGTNPAETRLRFDPESPIADGRWPYEH